MNAHVPAFMDLADKPRGSDVQSHAKMPTCKFNIDDTVVVPQLRDGG